MEQPPDHELLIRLDEKVQQVLRDVRELKDNLASRMTKVEEGKVDRVEAYEYRTAQAKVVIDQELRIRRLEVAVALAGGAFVVIEIIIKYFYAV